MSAEEIQRRRELIATLKRRKHERELQKAMFGISVDPSVVIDIENIDKQIEQLEQEIKHLELGKRSIIVDRTQNPISTVDTPVPPAPPDTSSLLVTLDFQVQDPSARIVWRSALIGREETVFTSPFDQTVLPLVIRALDVVQYPNYPEPNTNGERFHFTFSDEEELILTRLNLWEANRVIANAYQVVGNAIYTALGDKGQMVLKSIRNVATDQRKTANYMLRFPSNAITLAALPWELLWDSEKNQATLIRGDKIDSAERYVDIDTAIPPTAARGERLHLLALSPTYNIPDDIRQEERAARLQSWDKLKADGKITYDEITLLTVPNLNDYLMNAPTRPDIIHYFGHGVYKDGKGYLLFDKGSGGKELVSAERLAAIWGDVPLIVIHACQSAMVSEDGGLLTGVAPALSLVSGAVVAMQLTVAISAATRFSQVFYDQLLGRGRSLQDAVARARQILFTEDEAGASWYVPTLYIRSREPQPVFFRT